MAIRTKAEYEIAKEAAVSRRYGAYQTEKGIQFTAVIPEGDEASLVLYKKGGQEPIYETAFRPEGRFGDVVSLAVEGLAAGEFEYTFRIKGTEKADAYARMIRVDETGTKRGAVPDGSYRWGADRPLEIPLKDCIAYKLHVRGFTMHPSSGVRNRGTFAGIAEKIPYLKRLGVSQIELFPAYEFNELPEEESCYTPFRDYRGEEEKKNYWGYASGYYFSPKESYAAGDDPVTELKDLVKKLHQNGIELIMEFYFTAGTNPVLIQDCLLYWMSEYHVDGFHVNSEVAPMQLLAADPALKKTKLLSNGFDVNAVTGAGRGFRNIAECNDGFMIDARRFLKGDEDQLNSFLYRSRRNPAGYGVVNYIACNNGFTLMDMVSYDAKHNEANGENNKDGTDYNYSWNCGAEGPTRRRQIMALRKKQIKNALMMVFLAQGTPMLLAGDEMGNSQEGNNNAYCQGNEISWLDWKTPNYAKFILPFVKQLIQLRREHPILHMPDEMRIMDYKSCGYPDLSYHGKCVWYPELESYNRQIGIMYCGKYAVKDGEEDNSFYIAYNMHWIPHEFALPTLPKGQQWEILINTGEEEIIKEERTLTVPERTTVLLISKG